MCIHRISFDLFKMGYIVLLAIGEYLECTFLSANWVPHLIASLNFPF
jgi:hypothetical protein